MATTSNDDHRNSDSAGCAKCDAALARGQRYCLECGARQGDLPPAVAARVGVLLRRDHEQRAKTPDGVKGVDAAEGKETRSHMPSPRAAAVAVLGMLGLGVLLGSATGQLAQSAGLPSILLELPAPAPPAEAAREARRVEPEEAPAEVAAPAAQSSVPYAPVPVEEVAPEPEPSLEPPELPEEEGLPEVKHVFLIVLGDNGYEKAFGEASVSSYLSETLPKKGKLLANYFAVTSGSLANQIALLSGQGPTAETAANCPNYADIAPGTISLEGQVEGSGCVYPAGAEALPSQLRKAGLDWKAYIEDIDNGAPSGQPATCRHPPLDIPDPNQLPVPGDAYETWRNPFVYFHSIVDSSECAEKVVGTDQLADDLKTAEKTPALVYVVPNACHSGGEIPCEPEKPSGAAASEEFLRQVVPAIIASPAYKEGGLIAITSAQAPQSGEKADSSSCCVAPAYPNLPAPTDAEPTTGPVKPTGGGGRIGMLLISPFVAAGSVNETSYYNHFSMLLTIEELFGLERLGYAKEIALLPFDSSVFDSASSEKQLGRERLLSRARSSTTSGAP